MEVFSDTTGNKRTVSWHFHAGLVWNSLPKFSVIVWTTINELVELLGVSLKIYLQPRHCIILLQKKIYSGFRYTTYIFPVQLFLFYSQKAERPLRVYLSLYIFLFRYSLQSVSYMLQGGVLLRGRKPGDKLSCGVTCCIFC